MRFRNAMTVLGLVATLAAAGSSSTALAAPLSSATSSVETLKTFDDAYGVTRDSVFSLPAIPIQRVKPEFRRQIVKYQTDE